MIFNCRWHTYYYNANYTKYSIHCCLILLQVNLEWTVDLPMTPPAISATCVVYDVTPIPPDPVENVVITFQHILPLTNDLVSVHQQGGRRMIDRLVVILRYTWSAPDFQGEGISGYQALLSRQPASDEGSVRLMGNLHQIGYNVTHDELVAIFDEPDTTFTLYFQVGIV